MLLCGYIQSYVILERLRLVHLLESVRKPLDVSGHVFVYVAEKLLHPEREATAVNPQSFARSIKRPLFHEWRPFAVLERNESALPSSFLGFEDRAHKVGVLLRQRDEKTVHHIHRVKPVLFLFRQTATADGRIRV